MSLGYLYVKINSQRIRDSGQPPEESIRVSSVISFPGRLDYDLVETVRFSDYLQCGLYSNRYTHLLGLPYGVCINSLENYSLGSAENSSHIRQRMIGGIYEERRLILSADFVPLPSFLQGADMSIVSQKLLSSSSLSLSGLISFSENVSEKVIIVTEVNCVECFPDGWQICASLKVPEYILSTHDIETIGGLIRQVVGSLKQGPAMFPCEIRIADARLRLFVDKQDMTISHCSLAVGQSCILPIVVDLLKIA